MTGINAFIHLGINTRFSSIPFYWVRCQKDGNVVLYRWKITRTLIDLVEGENNGKSSGN